MYRRILGALLIAGGLLLAGCSAPSPATQDSPQADSGTDAPWPGWYRADAPLHFSSAGGWTLHSAALGADSARAAAAALEHARDALSSQLSSQLEQLRSRVSSSEAAKDTGIGTPAFVLALRKAEKDLGGLANRERVEARPSGQASSWRAFVEIRLTKQELTQHLQQALASHMAAWQVLRSSQAYRQWGEG